MTKKEHVDLVLSGQTVERPPVCLWYHFGVPFREPEKFAEVSLAFFRHYDLDWLKVMNDFFYPLPEGLEGLDTIKDLSLVRRMAIEDTDWARQLKALETLARELDGQAYFIDTVFEPWQALKRNLVSRDPAELAEESPEAVLAALDTISETLIDYCRASLAAGSAGIFMSTLASREITDRQLYLKFAKPFAMKIFKAIKDEAPMNTAHVHGKEIYTDDVLDFPVSILSFEDRVDANPSAAEMKEKFSGSVMCGIDRAYFGRATPGQAAAHVREGREMGGTSRFFLANGCSLMPEYSHRVLEAAMRAAKG